MYLYKVMTFCSFVKVKLGYLLFDVCAMLTNLLVISRVST